MCITHDKYIFRPTKRKEIKLRRVSIFPKEILGFLMGQILLLLKGGQWFKTVTVI